MKAQIRIVRTVVINGRRVVIRPRKEAFVGAYFKELKELKRDMKQYSRGRKTLA